MAITFRGQAKKLNKVSRRPKSSRVSTKIQRK